MTSGVKRTFTMTNLVKSALSLPVMTIALAGCALTACSKAPLAPMASLDAACNIVVPGQTPPVDLDRAPKDVQMIMWKTDGFEMTEAYWVVTKAGRGCFINPRMRTNLGLPRVQRDFTVTPQEFDALAAKLNYDRLQPLLTDCHMVRDDDASGSLSFYGSDGQVTLPWGRGQACKGSELFYRLTDSILLDMTGKAL